MSEFAYRLNATSHDRREYALKNLPVHLHKAGDGQRLFGLIGNDVFRKQQLERFDQPKLVTKGLDYAVDMAVQALDPRRRIWFSMLRINDTAEWFRIDLSQLVTLAQDRPQRAWEIATLIPEPAIGRMALLLLSWLLSGDGDKREFVCKLLTEAGGIRVLATVGQTSVLLEMIRELYCAGFDQAKECIRTIPDSPVRRAYQTAWEHGRECARALADEMIAVMPHLHEAHADEIAQFSRIQETIGKLEGQLGRGMKASTFEE